MSLSPLILTSFASLKTQFFISSFENKRKSLKISKTLVSHFLLALPTVPHSLVMSPVHLIALYFHIWVRTPVKVKRHNFTLKNSL